MCGFAGLFVRGGAAPGSLEAEARVLIGPIVHRGPDDSGVWENAQAGVGFGFRRLAILDLSPLGHQPMHSRSGRYTITFNGEVYNHGDLRRELEATGHTFRGHSDTEVMLAACEAWGSRQAISRFAGMFAFALWDNAERRLTLARDRLGKKPLFIFHHGGLLLFGSELKALAEHPRFLRVADPDAVASYLRYGYVPAPGAIYRHVQKLRPGHFLEITDPAQPLPASESYWDVVAVAAAARRRPVTVERRGLDDLAALLDDAVSRRLESDVPLGALLSGGIDSSLVVARMQAVSGQRVRTFTIGFDEPEWDESSHAADVAAHIGTDHTMLRLSGRDALAVVPDLPMLFDEPLANPSHIPTLLVCRLARRDVTVALCGDGGDELFGGYNRYVAGPTSIAQALRVPPLVRGIGSRVLLGVSAPTWDAVARSVLPSRWRPRLVGEKAQKLGRMLAAGNVADAYRWLVSAVGDPAELMTVGREPQRRDSELLADPSRGTMAERMMLADQMFYLPDDLLAKVDRASMAVSLEVRAPLLDYRIVEFAWQMPIEMKIRGGVTKWALRELLARDVPRSLFERPKMGFSVPIRAWLTGPLRPWAEDLLSDASLREIPLLSGPAVQREWQALLAGHAASGYGMWTLLQLIAWWRVWKPTLG